MQKIIPGLAAAVVGFAALGAVSASASAPSDSGILRPKMAAGVVTAGCSGMITGANPFNDCSQSTSDALNDHHTFKLTVPAGFYTGGRHVVLTVTEQADTADSILTVNRDTKSVGSSDNGSAGGAESITLNDPTSAAFDAITCAFAGASKYNASVTLRTSFESRKGPVGGTSRTAGPSTYGNYPLAKIPGSDQSGEPSIGVDWTNGNVYFQANLNTIKANFPATGSAPPALKDVSCLLTTVTTLDPILFTDSVTGRTGVSQLDASPAGINSITNFFQGNPTAPQPVCALSQGGGLFAGPDHQTLGGGRYPKQLPTGAGLPGSAARPFYYCSQTIAAGALCARSDDNGATFVNGTPPYTTECGGLHGHVRVGPEGNVYLPNKACAPTQGLAVSTNGNLTWVLHKVTGTSPSDGSDPSVAADRAGTIYFAGISATGKPFVSVSTTKGSSWKAPVFIGDAVHIEKSVFPEVIAGDAGRATIAFVGTPTKGDRNLVDFGVDPNTKRYTGGTFDLYASTTVDGGATWHTQDITPTDPVQRGQICTNGTTCKTGRNLLDFNDITVDKAGHVLIGYSDGCTAACVTSKKVADNKQTNAGVIARQISGPLLFVPPAKPGPVKKGNNDPTNGSKPGDSSGQGSSTSASGSGSSAGSHSLASTGLDTTLPTAGVVITLLTFGAMRRRRSAASRAS